MIRQLAQLPFRRAWTARIVFALVLVSIIQISFSSSAFAQSLNGAPSIFDVRRSLPLEPDEESFHDFYINVGPEGGFKKGMYITVVRQIPVTDPILNKQQATLTINVAKLHVIHVERGITVARLIYEFTDEERPTLEYESVMIGDKIDPTSFTMEAPSTKKKKKVVEAEPMILETVKVAHVATPEPAAATAQAPAPPVLVASSTSPSQPAPGDLPLASVQNANQPASQAANGKNASPASSAPDMVRVPVPGSGPKK